MGKKHKMNPAMWGILGMVFGFAAGDILPDPTDWMYFNAVRDGSIANPVTAMLVYYVYPGLFWGALFIIIMAGFTFRWFGMRVAVWMISLTIIGSTVLIIITVNPMFVSVADYIIDGVLSFACFMSILYVEGKLTWTKFKKLFR